MRFGEAVAAGSHQGPYAVPAVRVAAVRRDALGLGGRDRRDPDLAEVIGLDPFLPVPDDSRSHQIANLRNRNRWRIAPWFAATCRILTTTVLVLKRLPGLGRLGRPTAISRITPFLVRRFGTPEVMDMIYRHLIIENQLERFVARNSGSESVLEPDLEPTTVAELQFHDGMNSIVAHDLNIFNLILDLGEAPDADLRTRPLDELDFSMLGIPRNFEFQPQYRRWIKLDAQSVLAFVVLLLALFLDRRASERALNSFSLDEPLMRALAQLTGDTQFLQWVPIGRTNITRLNGNVGAELLNHIVAHEYAHTYLRSLQPTAGQQT